ncbi:CBS domain-containing protein [Agarivorans sp.]|uniref:CBS domain-containing protein n=1 Tax=Agarivorans sp. TaxID=1872412 RepID=UPI003CFC37CA
MIDRQISAFMQSYVVGVELDDSVEQVCQTLDQHQLHCVPVFTPDKQVFGVISASDLVHFSTLHEDPKQQRAWEVCSHKVITVNAAISARQAAELMVEQKIHHLLVMNEQHIVGIVSSLDLIQACLLNQN